jgi:trimethylamine--corrinoid protein Co-methyltransferase
VLPYGAPELPLNTAAAADLARYYALPVWGYAGCSDAKVVDQQAALEATGSIFMSLLAGNHLVHDVGYLESGLMSSFEMLVLSDTAIEMGRHLFKPIQIEPETLALDVIERVGPGGHFMGTDHTLKHFREIWYNDLIDRQQYGNWVAEGELTMGERLNRKVQEIIEGHTCRAMPPGTLTALETRLSQAEKQATG